MKLNELSPAALKAAMKGGTHAWGQRASIFEHIMYVEPARARRGQYRKCRCGCDGKAKFSAKANGIAMATGCEISMQKFANYATAHRRNRP